MTDNAAEIAKIEHELEILRSRYAIFAYWAKVVKWVCIGAAVVIPTLLILAAVTKDPIMALLIAFAVGLPVLVTCLFAAFSRFRWIDLVSPAPWGGLWYKSEAMAIEAMIAEREARLAQLRSSPA